MFRIFFYFLFFLFAVLQSTFSQNDDGIKLINKNSIYKVGDKINLEFSSVSKKNLQLYVSNSYGSSVLKPIVSDNTYKFIVPEYLSNIRGILNWKLVGGKNIKNGKITINPQDKPTLMETYLGPPSIISGGKDFSMLVIIPTDSLDNPLKDSTTVFIKTQFLKSENIVLEKTENLFAYKNIFSPNKSGRMIISSEAKGLNSNEFDVNIRPNNALNFTINYERNHDYADGNQIITFTTSVIKDKFDNIVSDGTYVLFYIKNKEGNIIRTSGSTINGIAKGILVHPEKKEEWQIKAYIIGFSESNILKVSFKQVMREINVVFDNNNRTLKVGPLKSFFNQMIPDGLRVKLTIKKDNIQLNEIVKTSKSGYVTFMLDENLYPNGNYDVIISSAGISKSFELLKLW